MKNKTGIKNIKKYSAYTYGGLLCIAFLAVMYVIKGFFPFGEDSIAVMDMCHGYIPVYYHLYDFLHGSKSLFFDFYSGTGVNMVGVAAVNGLLSPLNLLFYFTTRNGILNFLNIFFAVKVFAAAVSAQFFFIKRFKKLNIAYASALSFLYAMSGFVLLYYMHIIWLDVVILFPFLIYFGEKMINGGKIYPYTLCLALTMVCSFYLGVMTLICLFFISGAYIFTLIPKDKRAKAVFNLGAGTAVGGLMPMFLLLPAFIQMRSSARYGFSSSITEIMSAPTEFNIYKTLMFYGLQIAFAAVFLILINYKKHPEKTHFTALSLFFTLAPLIIEGSAAVIHFGSYKDFPYRFGFISVFMLLSLTAEQLSTEEAVLKTKAEKSKKLPILKIIGTVVSLIALIGSLVFSFKYFGKRIGNLSSEFTAVILFILITAVGCVFFAFIRRLNNKNIRRISALIVCICQMFPLAVLSMGTGSPIRYERREHDTEYIKNATEISSLITTDNTKAERVHNPDMSLNINYGFVLGKSALSNWTHQIPSYLQTAARNLGYSTTYTLLLDGGGTVFSDALLNMTQSVAKNELNNKTTSVIGKKGGFTVYRNEYTLPIGMFGSADLTELEIKNPLNFGSIEVFNNQNKLYSALGGSGRLIRTVYNDITMLLGNESSDDAVTYCLRSGTNDVLYFTSLKCAWNSIEIKVNGKDITVPSYRYEDNKTYSSEYNNNVTELGSFGNSTVIVEIKFIGDNVDRDDFAFGFLSLDKMSALSDLHADDCTEFSAEKNKINISCNNQSQQTEYIFIPLAYDKGWSCKVNGETADVICVAEGFTAVAVPPGTAEIEMKFSPIGFKTGLILTITGTAFFAVAVYIAIKKKEMLLPIAVEKGALYLFSALFACGSFAVYILPLMFSVVSIFKK